MRNYEEAREQSALIEWAGYMQKRLPDLRLIFHIPNGGYRNEVEAANLKRQGVKSGVPDLFLPVAKHGFHGLFIEMKTKNGKVTENQERWLRDLSAQGYLAVICRGADEAKKIIEDYLTWTSQNSNG